MKIIRTQVNDDNDTLKQVHLKVDREDGAIVDRNKMEAYMYPNYDEQIRLTIPGIGFSLFHSEAVLLHELLTASLNEFKE